MSSRSVPCQPAPPRLIIAGLGPAGVVLALRAAQRGWDVVCHDPSIAAGDVLPDWTATYGVVEPEVPSWAERFFRAPVPLTVIAEQSSRLGFRYRMLDKQALRSAFREAGIPVHRSAAPVSPPGAIVVTCTGAPRSDEALWQLAVGVVVSFPDTGAPLSSDAPTRPAPEAVFMDWRGEANSFPPSFLYVQEVEDGWLFEETILATHCSASVAEQRELVSILRERLQSRLHTYNPALCNEATVVSEESVSIPMGSRRGSMPAFFGAAAGLIHPATGYSLGASLASVDGLLDDIQGQRLASATEQLKTPRRGWGRWRDLTATTRSKKRRVENRSRAWLAYLLRQVGGELIARADQQTLRSFFECFFSLPASVQLDYLTGHDGVAVARAMWRLRTLTGFRHPFLAPLWKRPWSVMSTVYRRLRRNSGF